MDTTKWYYFGPDEDTHGPHTSNEMYMWVQSGYFKPELPIKTDKDKVFYPLGEWTRMLNGKLPFGMPIVSWDHLVAQAHPPPVPTTMGPGGMMMVPPGLAPPFPPPGRYAAAPHPYVAAVAPQPHIPNSQPPSEPIDNGSLSNTPDSENDVNHQMQQMHLHQMNHYHQQPHQGQGDCPPNTNMGNGFRHAAVMTAVPPPMKTVSVGTERTITQNVHTQTTPVIINSKDASRILSELTGLIVHVT